MKFNNKVRYQAPVVSKSRLEAEGILCGSVAADPNVDELHNINADDDFVPKSSYFEF